MYKILTVEREYGSGGGDIAAALASRLGWTLWDNAFTERIARLANVDHRAVLNCDERAHGPLHRLAKAFWRGSYESQMRFDQPFDADVMVEFSKQVLYEEAAKGNCIFVGRGSPYFLRGRPDAFHVFLYAPRAEKLKRLECRMTRQEAEEQLERVDLERIEFVKHYFHADWPTRALYDLMINTSAGNEAVIDLTLDAMKICKR
ncbi:MAG: cytidylate kinase-like family protein [Acidobacteriales bacterium]|nr:cytidylate kinase-like family protein [Terriglobales bacterium]